MKILDAHLANCEDYLLAISKVPSISGHSLHKGTPREAFIKEFLMDHLPTDLAVGYGELIDHRTEEKDERNNQDVVIYESSFPRIHYGGGVNAFLRESVVATIEVKSTLDQDDTLQAIKAGYRAKQLQASGYLRMRPMGNYIVAYDGPAKMKTVFEWISDGYHHQEVGKTNEKPVLWDPDLGNQGRLFTPSAALDGVFVLGVGACLFENNVGFSRNYPQHSSTTWSIVDCDHGALLMLFLNLLGLMQSDNNEINPSAYATTFKVPTISFGRIYSDRFDVFPVTNSAS